MTPTTPQRLVELAERVERATGPDRLGDAEIHRIITGGTVYDVLTPAGEVAEIVPAYTASLDAAMTLADGYFKLESDSLKGWRALGLRGPWCHAATPALALTAASLRTRAATETPNVR